MRALLIALPLLVAATPVFAGTPCWQFRQNVSQIGPVCQALVSTGRLTVGFSAAPGGDIAAVVYGISLPEAAYSTWQVRGYQWQQLYGGKHRESGTLMFTGVDAKLLSEIASGNKLDIYVHATMLAGNAPIIGSFDIPLRGSARALAQFQDCYQGYAYQSWPVAVAPHDYGMVYKD